MSPNDPILVDAHEDLAWNMQSFGRDYTRSAYETRRLEAGGPVTAYNGDCLLGWPEYQRGRVAVVFATLFVAPQTAKMGEWDAQCYADYEQANALYHTQLDAYRRLCDQQPDKFRLVLAAKDLEEVLADWEKREKDLPVPSKDEPEAMRQERQQAKKEGAPDPFGRTGHPVGLVMLMEGAEGVRSPGELEDWWQAGVRLVGPAWHGTRFCGGTLQPGPMTREGYALLDGMASLGFALDISHMDEAAVLQALDSYPGAIIASHSNARPLIRGTESNRHLTERMLDGLLERDGITGLVPYNGFLKHGWKMADGRQAVTLRQVVAQIDYVCQRAGDARHAGLGTDFDGGFGWQSVPAEIDTIVDLHKLSPLLGEMGYSDTDVSAILGQNWLGLLRRILPEVL